MPATGPSPTSRAPEGPAGTWLSVDVVHDDGDWPDEAEIEPLISAAAQAVAAHRKVVSPGVAQACIALSSDAAVKELNAGYRGKDQPTNVLSFPAGDGPVPGGRKPLGDIVLALETVAREAGDRGIPFAHHLQHLTVHGLLHLLGYDHETDAQAVIMEGLETEILAGLGIADPYGDRDEPVGDA